MDIPKELELRAIHVSDDLGKLSLGNANYTPLKIFLKKAAWDFLKIKRKLNQILRLLPKAEQVTLSDRPSDIVES